MSMLNFAKRCLFCTFLIEGRIGSDSLAEDQTQLREEKFLSWKMTQLNQNYQRWLHPGIFQIVKFHNNVCSAVDGHLGACFTASECISSGGRAMDTCASGFGVCCVVEMNTCSSTAYVQQNNSYLVSPGFPSGVSGNTEVCNSTTSSQTSTSKTYEYTIKKASEDIVQFRLDFIWFEIEGPISGNCDNDSLTISGADAVTSAILPTNLCGVLTNHHIYVSVKDLGSNNVTLAVNLATRVNQNWEILVRQFSSSQTDFLAPHGCLQYFKANAGTISTFNHDGGNGQLLNDAHYSVCIAQSGSMCDVTLTSTSFELTSQENGSQKCSDALTYGFDVVCGDTFGTLDTATWAYMGPYVLSIKSDDDNAAMAAGFSLNYTLLPC